MSTPVRAKSGAGQTPVTGSKRRHLGIARRKRTADICFPEDDDVLKQGQCAVSHGNRDCDRPDEDRKSNVQHCEQCDKKSPSARINHPVGPTVTPIGRRGPQQKAGRPKATGEAKNDRPSSTSKFSACTEEPSPSGGSSQSQQRLQFTPNQRLPLRHTVGSSASARKRFRHEDFKSPMRTPAESTQPAATVEGLSEEVARLQKTANELKADIEALTNEGYCEEELQTHIDKMHEYNELKDTGQMLLGKIAYMYCSWHKGL